MKKKAIASLREHLEAMKEEDVFEAVVKAIAEAPQFSMAQYPERAVLLSNVTKEGTARDTLSRFVAGLCIEYNSIFVEVSTLRASERYCALQTQWMQRIREIIEAGESLATCKVRWGNLDKITNNSVSLSAGWQ